jgi:hypothetical protein
MIFLYSKDTLNQIAILDWWFSHVFYIITFVNYIIVKRHSEDGHKR